MQLAYEIKTGVNCHFYCRLLVAAALKFPQGSAYGPLLFSLSQQAFKCRSDILRLSTGISLRPSVLSSGDKRVIDRLIYHILFYCAHDCYYDSIKAMIVHIKPIADYGVR